MIRKVITSTDYEYIDVVWDGTRYTQRRQLAGSGSPDYIPLTLEEFLKELEFVIEIEGKDVLQRSFKKAII